MEWSFGLFWRRKKFDVGGGKCEVDAPQSNKCEFNHSGHINSELSSILKRKNIKMLITKFLVFSGKLLKYFLVFSAILSMADVRFVL